MYFNGRPWHRNDGLKRENQTCWLSDRACDCTWRSRRAVVDSELHLIRCICTYTYTSQRNDAQQLDNSELARRAQANRVCMYDGGVSITSRVALWVMTHVTGSMRDRRARYRRDNARNNSWILWRLFAFLPRFSLSESRAREYDWPIRRHGFTRRALWLVEG